MAVGVSISNSAQATRGSIPGRTHLKTTTIQLLLPKQIIENVEPNYVVLSGVLSTPSKRAIISVKLATTGAHFYVTLTLQTFIWLANLFFSLSLLF